MKHLLKLADLSREEILSILNLADQLKYERKNGIDQTGYLKGKTLIMIFSKSSTRTRVSFDVGITELGGHPLFLSNSESQIGRGEPVQDTARVLSRMAHGIMIRTFAQQEVEDLARYGSIPVINGLTDYCHPCQVLADLMTIREYKGSFRGLKLCFVGDGNNMANSLMVGAVKMGMKFSIACPKGYEPDAKLIEWAKREGDFSMCDDPVEAARDADVLYTDVWASMGQEEEKKVREEAFRNITIDREVMKAAKPGAMLLHCLPVHRGEEVSEEIFEEHAEEIFDEAENRLHAQKAVLVKLMK